MGEGRKCAPVDCMITDIKNGTFRANVSPSFMRKPYYIPDGAYDGRKLKAYVQGRQRTNRHRNYR